MKILLTEDVKKLGKKGEIVDVSEGYAKNFILPKKLGVEATKAIDNEWQIKKGSEENRKRKEEEQAKALAQQMVNDLAVGEYGVTTPMDLLREADRTATATLEQYRDALLTLSDMLCQSGTLSGDAIRKMLPTPAAAV